MGCLRDEEGGCVGGGGWNYVAAEEEKRKARSKAIKSWDRGEWRERRAEEHGGLAAGHNFHTLFK